MYGMAVEIPKLFRARRDFVVSISCPEVIELAAAARQLEIISRRSLHSNCRDGLWECSHATEAKESGERGREGRACYDEAAERLAGLLPPIDLVLIRQTMLIKPYSI